MTNERCFFELFFNETIAEASGFCIGTIIGYHFWYNSILYHVFFKIVPIGLQTHLDTYKNRLDILGTHLAL